MKYGRELHTRVRFPETGPVLCQNLMSDSLTQAKVSDSMIRIDLHPYESCVYLLGAANAEMFRNRWDMTVFWKP